MSLLTRILFTNIGSKRVTGWSYIYNEIVSSCERCYTCSNYATKILSKDFKFKKVGLREASVLSHIKLGSENITLNLIKFFEALKYLPFFKGRKFLWHGALWFKSLDEIKVEEFFTCLNMEDTFFSRYVVIELHIWMLLFALAENSRDFTAIKNSIISLMWEDTQIRAKLIHEFNKNFRKNMRCLYEKFKMSLILYDLGYMDNDKALASSVWYNFFSSKDVDPRYIEIVVRFIRFQIHHLKQLNLEELKDVENKSGIWLSIQPHADEIFKQP